MVNESLTLRPKSKCAGRAAAILPPVRRGGAVPFAPGSAGERLEIGRERTAGLPLIGRDDPFGIPDLPSQFGHRLVRLADALRPGDLAKIMPGGLDLLQRLAVLFDLGPMPCDLAVAVCDHA